MKIRKNDILKYGNTNYLVLEIFQDNHCSLKITHNDKAPPFTYSINSILKFIESGKMIVVRKEDKDIKCRTVQKNQNVQDVKNTI
jgi:hypothetical protein